MTNLHSAMSRRDLLRWSSGALLAAGLWPGVLPAAAAPRVGSFEFISINDLHHDTPDCTIWLEKVVQQLKTHRNSKLCLILGDLSDQGKEESLRVVAKTFQSLRQPLHIQIGNHDYLPSGKGTHFDTVFAEQRNTTFRHAGWQFIGVDSTDGLKYEKTHIQPATLEWMDRTLPKLDPKRPTILFTHFPMAEGVSYRPLNSDALLDKLRDFNLKAVFSGHYHALTEKENAAHVPMTTNRCCSHLRGNHDGSKEKGYLLCKATPEGVQHRFIEVPA